MNEQKVSATVIVPNPQGIHARPAHMFVMTAVQFESSIAVLKDGARVDGKSILDMLTLVAGAGSELLIEATGSDAQAAIDALTELVRQGFGEN